MSAETKTNTRNKTTAKKNIQPGKRADEIVSASNPGRISAVTVYSDRAELTRELETEVEEGLQEIRLTGLSAAIDPDSIRISGRGSAQVKIMGFALAVDYLPELWQAEIKTLEKETSAQRVRLEVLTIKESYLRNLARGGGAAEDRKNPPDRENWADLLGFLDGHLAGILGEKADLEIALSENEKKLEVLRKNQAANSSREGRALVISLEARMPGKASIQVLYQVRGASWRPVYTMRGRPAEKQLEITMMAEVTQRSGEDWHNVNLTLSSAAPALGAQPPKLRPWFLAIRQTPFPDEERDFARAAGDMIAPGLAQGLAVMEVESALLGEQGVHVTFNARTPFSAASDGTARRVPLDSRTVEAGFFHSAVPKLRPEAFLAARTAPRLPYPLLAGECQLFMDDEFVAKSRIPTLAAGEEFVLHFGVDRQVLVKHEQIGGRRVAPVFLGRNRKLEHSYRISLENLHKTEISLELSDQLPVSRDSRLEIKSVELNPRPDGREENGLLSWKMKLAPGEKKEISISFSVEFPKDLQLSNGLDLS